MDSSHTKGLGQSLFVGCAMLALMMILATSVFAQHAAKGNASDDANANASGQQVSVDAKSGKLRKPTQEEIDALVSGMKLNDSSEGLKAKSVGNGTVVMDLEGRFETATVAKINPDGTVSTACVNNAKGAKDFLKADTTNPKQKTPATTGQKLEEK
jgi:hypothetical protein